MRPEPGRHIYTLGTSTRTAEGLLSVLKAYDIELVADVRSFPTSRFEHFRQKHLAGLLDEAGIAYVYLGKELGGYRKMGYLNYIATGDFQAGVGKLERIAAHRKSAFLCAERFPWRCHRRFIAGEMEKRGWQVTHIIDEKRVWQPHPRLPLD